MDFLFTRRFLPLFITQFLGAFNDNFLKNALVILITYTIAIRSGENAHMLITVAAGLFILPFFLFSALAGQIADKFERAKITQFIKIAEIIIMCLATIGFVFHNSWFLIMVLFLAGVHSTFFGPIKYALLPQYLSSKELLSGNAYIEGGTFVAILLGTIIGGLLIIQANGEALVSLGLIVVACLGYASSRYLPLSPAPMPNLNIELNLYIATRKIIEYSRNNELVFFAILCISWFWFIGATYLAQFPTFVKDNLHTQAAAVTILLTMFTVGIAIGSILCVKILKGKMKTTLIVPSLLIMSLFMIDLYFACKSDVFFNIHGLLSYQQFIHLPESWRIMGDILLVAICSGIYIVPLYAIMQHESHVNFRARIIAANNVINAFFMVVSAIYCLILLHLSLDVSTIFLGVGIMNLIAAYYIKRILSY